MLNSEISEMVFWKYRIGDQEHAAAGLLQYGFCLEKGHDVEHH